MTTDLIYRLPTETPEKKKSVPVLNLLIFCSSFELTAIRTVSVDVRSHNFGKYEEIQQRNWLARTPRLLRQNPGSS